MPFQLGSSLEQVFASGYRQQAVAFLPGKLVLLDRSNPVSFVLDLESEFKIPANTVFFYPAFIQHKWLPSAQNGTKSCQQIAQKEKYRSCWPQPSTLVIQKDGKLV